MQKNKKDKNPLHRFSLRLTNADITFFILPLIMLNLIAGTLAQHSMGLYAAQKMFFSSFITWIGPVPLPGGYILIGLFTLSLLLKFILRSSWHLNKTGIILSHLGVLIILIGGLFTALTAREGYMVIAENTQTPYVYDYHQRELFIFENDQLKQTIPFQDIQTEQTLNLGSFKLKILSRCENCKIIKREDAHDKLSGLEPQSLASFMALESQTPEKEPEENLSGISFELQSSSLPDLSGFYIAFESMPKPITLQAEGTDYKLIFGKKQTRLPFSLHLNDFTKKTYPGSFMAQAYSSDIIVKDNDLEWPVTIEMNKPLRYKGYTFYQSSFQQSAESEVSILSVVQNQGQIYPYIGTVVLAIGLIAHIIIMRKRVSEKP